MNSFIRIYMITLGLVCLLLTGSICPVVYGQQASVAELRSLYGRSYREREPAERLLRITASATRATPVIYGYKAIASIMMCNHYNNPYTKLKSFYTGKTLLEQAIKSNAADPELRYLRFAVQCNAPAILNYNSNIKEDKQLLISYLQVSERLRTDQDLYRRICEFLISCRQLTEHERTWVRSVAGSQSYSPDRG